MSLLLSLLYYKYTELLLHYLTYSQEASMYDATQELQYLDMVIQESLRMYPPAPR